MLAIGAAVGRYTLEARLGAGGMGEVYRAFDAQLRRQVALKVLLASADDAPDARAEWTARMIREARAAAAFNHPNAVTVYDVGEHDGSPFIVMELVPGRTLRSYVGDDAVPLARRVRWLADAARALGAAHRAGLVHRDVKPDNVMVRDDGLVKILDFGIARQSAGPPDPSMPTARSGLETLTKSGTLVGTPLYMAPEQLRQQPLDGRTDQFAWGVMAYQLLSGRPPWDAPDVFSLAAAIAADPPASIRALVPDISPGVEAALLRAVEKRPEDRFPSMEDAATALEAQPVQAAGEGASPPAPVQTSSQETTTERAVASSPPPRRTWTAPLAVVAITVGSAAAWTLYGRAPPSPPSLTAAASAPAPVPSASAEIPPPATSASAAPPEPPLRHPCAAPQPSAAGLACAKPLVRWCDAEERPIACCAKGLAAVGEDGLCACPPGGSRDAPDAPPACAKSKGSVERIQLVVRAHFDELRGCYEGALRKSDKAQGRVSIHFEMTPEGRVFSARVADASLPDPEAQACVLRAFRRLQFDPPPDGTATVTYPIVFSPGG